MFRLILRSATYHWRTNLGVMLGVAAAVSVFAGALLVGDSVRGSLRDLAIGGGLSPNMRPVVSQDGGSRRRSSCDGGQASTVH